MLLLLQVSYYLFETYGILYTNATISGLVLAVVPLVAIGTGALFLREYPTRRQALFCILPVAGVLFLQEPVSIALLLGAVLILVGIRQVNKAK